VRLLQSYWTGARPYIAIGYANISTSRSRLNAYRHPLLALVAHGERTVRVIVCCRNYVDEDRLFQDGWGFYDLLLDALREYLAHSPSVNAPLLQRLGCTYV